MGQPSPKWEMEIKVTLALPFMLHLRDGTYRGRIDKEEFSLHLQSYRADLGKGDDQESRAFFQASTGKLTEAYQVKIPGAMLQYSLVTIHFHRKGSIISETNEQVIQDSVSRAHRFLNHFIEVYRVVTSDTDARTLANTEYQRVRAGQALHYCINSPGERKCLMGVQIAEPGITAPLPEFLGSEVEKPVKEILIAGRRPSIVALLLLNAQSFLEEGQFRLSVIELGSALDVNVEQTTRNLLKSRGELTEEMSKKLEKLTTAPIVEQILSSIVKQDILNSPEWSQIHNKFRPLRNSVIHDAYEPTQAESADALQIVQSFHELLAKVT
jgi:hypothetical protein